MAMFNGHVDKTLAPRVAIYSESQYFAWHVDVPHPPRTVFGRRNWLTLSIQLVPGDAYTGGDFICADERDGRHRTASRALGHVVAFPAAWRHTVQPITSGTRASFVFCAAEPIPPSRAAGSPGGW